MGFQPDLAAIRFGTGLGPAARPPASAGQMLDRLTAPDDAAKRYPIASFASQLGALQQSRRLSAAKDEARSDAARRKARDALSAHRDRLDDMNTGWFKAMVARSLAAEDGFRERLTRFWADHFTVAAKYRLLRAMVPTFCEDAIRPHVAGRFPDMLKAAIRHPMMLSYLDQISSVGPGSRVAMETGKGINENLAREVLELHTLGVGGGYGQSDVGELALILAGLTFTPEEGAVFRKSRAAPGEKRVLGHRYGGAKPESADIDQVLDDLAAHPDTARHIARKLAVHFISDRPAPELVRAIAGAYRDSDGDLVACYRAMLAHPAAWTPVFEKAKQPVDFVISGARALGVSPEAIMGLGAKKVRTALLEPMRQMGQRWEHPPGPDGWAEDAAQWITPQGLAARINWAMSAPRSFVPSPPAPRSFAQQALGSILDDETALAAQAAGTRWEGIGVVLASPRFQLF